MSAAGRVVATATPAAQPPGHVLTVVIEGDGRAHDRGGRPTADPTPSRPIGLAIARAWPDGPRAWVARPCQFTRGRDPACRPGDWTADRFSAPMLAALDAAVDDLKRSAGVGQVRLVGWSGGGVMAAALAGRRSDVAELVTIAAPLDVQAWTSARRLSPLNLAPEVAALAAGPLPVAQRHLLGERDGVVPPASARAWATRLGGADSVRTVDEAHAGAWPKRLKDPEILKPD
ncbi:hypothetical protein [Phenylobacterium kunshanense]|uniref:Alpha/beta hydrolase n=1 Tax=Phenylobacterium kunshanense TaxID=1445034 RepID=A0A328BJV5_9CAUL|nr:hypothetical protein [Phenylobacterium kunshanense]RAK67423.1 hypothetical protein DJ019_05770 [Phenylobacterium kunshanense]